MKFKKSIKNSTMLQIILYYLIGNVLFIIFLISIFYYSSRHIILQKEIEYNKEKSQNKARYITLYIEKLKNIINLMAIDAEVEGFLDEEDELAEIGLKKMVQNVLNDNKSIRSVTIAGKNSALIFNEGHIEKKSSKNMVKENWYINAVKNPDIPVFSPSQKISDSLDNSYWVLSLSHHVKSLIDGKNLGVIVLDIKYDIFNQYLDMVSPDSQNESIIIDDKNNIIYYA